jgi:hypothetical protein
MNRRSLHYATPDFLSSLVALATSMRLSLVKAAHAGVGKGRVTGNPGALRSEAVTFLIPGSLGPESSEEHLPTSIAEVLRLRAIKPSVMR